MDRFLFYKKWFWIGIVVGFMNGIAGLIYGLALVVEPQHRREGLVVIIWSLAAFILTFMFTRYLQSIGVLPTTLLVPPVSLEASPILPE